ncbi:histidine phosphatase superfamily [Xylariaceae sp. AK1471]|nr:histidine phosphatase superfamily [Xylariaceae sp. AK1471]
MAPTIHIVRHAQALHNASMDFNIHDPELTELGLSQCSRLASEFPHFDEIECVIASPMTRTIQTAQEGFKPFTQHRGVVLLSILRENGISPSDTGSSREVLELRFSNTLLNYSLLEPDWVDKGYNSRYPPRNVTVRARSARLYIRAISQKWRSSNAHIVVVTHGDFIQYLTKDQGPMFENAEWRSYQFERRRDPEADLVETAASRSRRGATQFRNAENVAKSTVHTPPNLSIHPVWNNVPRNPNRASRGTANSVPQTPTKAGNATKKTVPPPSDFNEYILHYVPQRPANSTSIFDEADRKRPVIPSSTSDNTGINRSTKNNRDCISKSRFGNSSNTDSKPRANTRSLFGNTGTNYPASKKDRILAPGAAARLLCSSYNTNTEHPAHNTGIFVGGITSSIFGSLNSTNSEPPTFTQNPFVTLGAQRPIDDGGLFGSSGNTGMKRPNSLFGNSSNTNSNPPAATRSLFGNPVNTDSRLPTTDEDRFGNFTTAGFGLPGGMTSDD